VVTIRLSVALEACVLLHSTHHEDYRRGVLVKMGREDGQDYWFFIIFSQIFCFMVCCEGNSPVERISFSRSGSRVALSTLVALDHYRARLRSMHAGDFFVIGDLPEGSAERLSNSGICVFVPKLIANTLRNQPMFFSSPPSTRGG